MICSLAKKYKAFEVKVSIEISTSFGLHVFCGKSGSGKTTVLECIYNKTELKDEKKSFMTSRFLKPMNMVVREILSWDKSKEYNKNYYEDLNISDIIDKRINRLSKEEIKRLMFFLSVSTNADLYFFDDPFSFVCKDYIMKMKRIIEKLSKDKAVFVACINDIFETEHNEYQLDNGKIAACKKHTSLNCASSEGDDTKLEIKRTKLAYIGRKIASILAALVIFLLIELVYLVFWAFNDVKNIQATQDVLGIFNMQNGIVVEGKTIDIKEDELIDTYYQIAEEEKLEIKQVSSFSVPQYFYVDNQIYSMDYLYACDQALDDYYASYYNPYLIKYFQTLYLNQPYDSLIEIIKNYDYENNNVVLHITGRIYEKEYNADILIKGVINSNYYFVGKNHIDVFYKMLVPSIPVKYGVPVNVPALNIYYALKSLNNSNDYLQYLSTKYSKYEYSTDINGYIIASQKNNVKVSEYLNYFENNSDIFAYSLRDNYYCLKNSNFFKQNNFRYIGSLDIKEGEVIISNNALKRIGESLKVNDNLLIDNKSYKIKAILTSVSDNNIYFSYSDYLLNHLPSYSYRAKVLVNDYLKSKEIIDEINQSNLGLSSKLISNSIIDYTKIISSLNNATNNVLDNRAIVYIVLVLVSILCIISLMLIVESSIFFNNNLDLLCIDTFKVKLFLFSIGITCVFILEWALFYPLLNLVQMVYLDDIYNIINVFPSHINKPSIDFNFLIPLFSIFVLSASEFIRPKRIRFLVRNSNYLY